MQNYNRIARVPGSVYELTTLNGSTVSSTNSRSMYDVGTELKNGSTVPDYRNRIARGVDATSSYERKGFNVVVPGFMMRSTNVTGTNAYDSVRREFRPVALPTIPSTSSGSLSQEASSILKRKLRHFTGQSNQLTNVVELKDLRRTIGTAVGSAGKLLAAVSNSKKRGKSLRNFAADQWLNFSFGILPTLSAVDDAVQSVRAYLERGDQRTTEYGVATEDWVGSTKTTITGSLNYNVIASGSFKFTRSVKITAGYKFNLRSSEDYTVGKHLGFDISSVVPTAYELLPYSWLIDYFTTAGSFLEDTFSADPGQSFYICENTRLNIEGYISMTPQNMNPATKLRYWYSRPAKFEYYGFLRSPLSNLPRAPLRFKTSKEVASHATNKLLNLTALLSSRR